MLALDSEETQHFDVVSVGEVLMDFIAPDATDLAHVVQFFSLPGGAPANVAVAVARLGGRAAFIGAVGDDPFGATLRRVLAEEGVDIAHLRVSTQPTTLAFVARNAGGLPDFVFYRGADSTLRADQIPAPYIARSRFLYISSMALLSEPARAATLYAMELAHEASVLVAFDPNIRPRGWPPAGEARTAIFSVLREADVVKLSDEEARLLADTHDLDITMSTLTGEKRLLVVTLGAQGCRWSLGQASGTVPAPSVEIIDTTGAGDAFMGALLRQLSMEGFTPALSGELDVANLHTALHFACAAGAYTCTAAGAMASLPTWEQVDGLLRGV